MGPLVVHVLVQTRHHRGHIEAVPPPTGWLCPSKRKLFPSPKWGLCREEINRFGASGVQIEAQISVFCGLTPDFVTFLGWRPFFLFGDHLFSVGKSLEILVKTFFLWRSPIFGRKNCLKFRFRLENPLKFQWRLFLFYFIFFWDQLFSAGKTAWNYTISAGKSLEIFPPHLVHLIQSGINFSCPRAPLEFTQNKLLVPPKTYFCPPVTLFWRRACTRITG